MTQLEARVARWEKPLNDLFVETWGVGTPAVLVHGSLATGAEEWAAQRPLADEGFRLLVPDRRGYGQSPPAEGEDFLRDGEDIAGLVDEPSHLVGHSYGGLGAMVAAVRDPGAARSLTLLEPAASTLGQDDPNARKLVERVRALWDKDLSNEDWLVAFLEAVGTDPGILTAEELAGAAALVPVFRRGRPPWDTDLPLAELSAAPFPKLVISGGHSAGFEAICDDLAERIGAERLVVTGGGHEIQLTGRPLNDALLRLWHQS